MLKHPKKQLASGFLLPRLTENTRNITNTKHRTKGVKYVAADIKKNSAPTAVPTIPKQTLTFAN